MRSHDLQDPQFPLFSSASILPAAQTGSSGAEHAKRPRQPAYVSGHRQRLRQRFNAGGDAALADYELLEMLLFRTLPRGDVKPLAWRLLDRFGDLNRVLAAPAGRLKEVEGVGPAVIEDLALLAAIARRMARARVLDRPAISGWQALLDYCHTAMSHRETEQVRVFYLDRKNVLVSDEAQGDGTVDHVPVYPREILKRALELNASALILVHNHPSGDPTPSEADIALTRQIEDGAQALGLTLHDHIIIGKSTELSLRASGYL